MSLVFTLSLPLDRTRIQNRNILFNALLISAHSLSNHLHSTEVCIILTRSARLRSALLVSSDPFSSHLLFYSLLVTLPNYVIFNSSSCIRSCILLSSILICCPPLHPLLYSLIIHFLCNLLYSILALYKTFDSTISYYILSYFTLFYAIASYATICYSPKLLSSTLVSSTYSMFFHTKYSLLFYSLLLCSFLFYNLFCTTLLYTTPFRSTSTLLSCYLLLCSLLPYSL